MTKKVWEMRTSVLGFHKFSLYSFQRVSRPLPRVVGSRSRWWRASAILAILRPVAERTDEEASPSYGIPVVPTATPLPAPLLPPLREGERAAASHSLSLSTVAQ